MHYHPYTYRGLEAVGSNRIYSSRWRPTPVEYLQIPYGDTRLILCVVFTLSG